MKISTKGRYALRLMLDLAYNEDGKLYMETVWKEGKIFTAKVYDANGNVTANTEGM